MIRKDVIIVIYRSLRDAFNSLDNVAREGNSIIIEKAGKRAKISFRVKIEDIDVKKIEMG